MEGTTSVLPHDKSPFDGVEVVPKLHFPLFPLQEGSLAPTA